MKTKIKILFLLIIVNLFSCNSNNKVKNDNPSSTEQKTATAFQCNYSNETNSLGVGLVQVVDNMEGSHQMIRIFNDSTLQEVAIEWNFKSETSYDEQPFCAKFHEPDYGHLEFICLEELEQSYKIIVNQNEVKYLPKDTLHQFISWEDYLLQSFAIRHASTDKDGQQIAFQKIYQQPDETSLEITLPKEKFQHFCILEVQDDWIQVTYDCFYNTENNPYEGEPCSAFIQKCQPSVTGWMKWKKRNKLLIDIFLRL